MGDREHVIREIQMKELNILKCLIDVFDKYKIKYALYYGSLIGAVRHHGFIPWDDDLDIVMPRSDYMRFKEIAPEVLPSYLFFQDYSTDSEYPSYTAKVRDSRTTMIEKGYRSLTKMNHGIWVDIFVLDYCDKSLLSKIKCFEIRLLQRIILESICSSHSTVRKILSSSIKPSVLLNHIDKLAQGLDRQRQNKYYILEYKQLQSVSLFETFTEIEFEDLRVMIPEQYDILLRSYYGDYMKLPPESERQPSHIANIVSVKKSYTDFFKEH